MNDRQTAIVVGAGPGLGHALVRRCAAGGMRVAAVSRRGLVPDGADAPADVRGYRCDATVRQQVDAMLAQVEADLGPPDLVVFNIGTWDRAEVVDISDALFEQAWRTGCFSGFLVGRAAATAMLRRGRGTIIFTGATGSLRGGAGFAAFAMPKFGLRALAQSMARELGPRGIHVAHVVIDGMIGEDDGAGSATTMVPAAIAEAYWQIHLQQRSAWSQEIDLRPAGEKF